MKKIALMLTACLLVSLAAAQATSYSTITKYRGLYYTEGYGYIYKNFLVGVGTSSLNNWRFENPLATASFAYIPIKVGSFRFGVDSNLTAASWSGGPKNTFWSLGVIGTVKF